MIVTDSSHSQIIHKKEGIKKTTMIRALNNPEKVDWLNRKITLKYLQEIKKLEINNLIDNPMPHQEGKLRTKLKNSMLKACPLRLQALALCKRITCLKDKLSLSLLGLEIDLPAKGLKDFYFWSVFWRYNNKLIWLKLIILLFSGDRRG